MIETPILDNLLEKAGKSYEELVQFTIPAFVWPGTRPKQKFDLTKKPTPVTEEQKVGDRLTWPIYMALGGVKDEYADGLQRFLGKAHILTPRERKIASESPLAILGRFDKSGQAVIEINLDLVEEEKKYEDEVYVRPFTVNTLQGALSQEGRSA